jgi:hypothetical protein
MFKPIKYTLFVLIVIASLLITACGAESTPDTAQEMSRIETAVAETVAAKDTSTSAPVTPIITQTPLLFSPTLTPLAVAAPCLPIQQNPNVPVQVWSVKPFQMAPFSNPGCNLQRPGISKTQAPAPGIPVTRSSFGTATYWAAHTCTTCPRPWEPDKLCPSHSS